MLNRMFLTIGFRLEIFLVCKSFRYIKWAEMKVLFGASCLSKDADNL